MVETFVFSETTNYFFKHFDKSGPTLITGADLIADLPGHGENTELSLPMQKETTYLGEHKS